MEFLNYQPTTLTLTLAICIAALILIQALYYILVFGKVSSFVSKKKKQKEEPSETLPAVSVVIATKNEEFFLKENLGLFLEQDYPEFEVIVVNDASTDDTQYVLKAFSKLYPRLNVVNIVENVNKFKGRKFPISLGVKAAKHDRIILAGADCVPSGFDWLKSIVGGFSGGKELVLGYVALSNAKSLAGKIMQYDNVTTTMNYMGLGLSGLAYRGNGKNLAFSKNLFFSVGGFTKHYNYTLGEDDIFVSQVATRRNTTVVLSKESVLSCSAKKKYRTWKDEKKRRLSIHKFRGIFPRTLLSTVPLTTFLIYIGVIISALCAFPYQYLIAALAIKFIIQTVAYLKACRHLNVKAIFLFAPLFELYFLLFDAKMRLIAIFSKRR